MFVGSSEKSFAQVLHASCNPSFNSLPLFIVCVARPLPRIPHGTWGQLTGLWLLFIEGQILAICLHVYSFSRQFQMHFVYRSSLNLPRCLPGESKREFIGFHPLLRRPPLSPYKLFIKRSSQLAEICCDVCEWVSMAPPSGRVRRLILSSLFMLKNTHSHTQPPSTHS